MEPRRAYGLDNGNEFICSRGRLVLSKRGVCRWFDAEGKERIYESPVIAGAGLRPHFENFVNAVTRGEALNADMTTAHLMPVCRTSPIWAAAWIARFGSIPSPRSS
ncbi:MAG: hypothetical protein R3B96_06840 [Pirellulaceae bacterium]